MICPFCHQALTSRQECENTTFLCTTKSCKLNSDLSRYLAKFSKHHIMIEETFYLDPYYIQVHCLRNFTLISILDVIVLYDTVLLPRAIELDTSNVNNTLNQIKTLLLFS